MKLNISACRAGTFDLGDRIYGDALGVVYHLLDKLFKANEDRVRFKDLIYFPILLVVFTSLKASIFIFCYFSPES